MQQPDLTNYEPMEYHMTQMEREAEQLIAQLKTRNPEFMSTEEVIAGIRNSKDMFATGDDPFMAICVATAQQQTDIPF